MTHTLLVIIHIAGALSALVSGFVALTFQNGVAAHRVAGKVYLLGWTALALAGALLGLRRPGLTAFEVLNAVGYAMVLYAYAQVIFRRRIGRIWLLRHFNWMLGSMAALVVATLNQLLTNASDALRFPYPFWLFWLMVIAPAFVLPRVGRRLAQRYGLVETRSPKREQATA